MKDWKTTVPGAISAIAGFIAAYPSHFGGEGTLTTDIAKFVALGGIAFLGINAKSVN